jgi:hypothetical protein
MYLVVIDYYSRWIGIEYLSTTTSARVIAKFKCLFSTHGIPDEVISDNGPQFASNEFKMFAQAYGFKHQTSSPHFPQANGEAEAAVKVAKSILSQENSDIALLNYRATPHSTTGVSPAEALMGRRLQTRIPVLPRVLKPTLPKHAEIEQSDSQMKARYKQRYDKRHGVQQLSPILPGDFVLMKTDKESRWKTPGNIVMADPDNRTYLVDTPHGVLRRNRKHLQHIPQDKNATILTTPTSRESTSTLVPSTTPVDKAPPDCNLPRTSSGRVIRKPLRFQDT